MLHSLIHKFVTTKLETELVSDSDAIAIRTAAAVGLTKITKRISFPVTLSTLEALQIALPDRTLIANCWCSLLPEDDVTWPMEALARVARSQSLWNEAESLYQRALHISEEQLGPNHPETGTRLNNLAGLYESTGRFAEAEPLYLRALQILTSQLGQDHTSTETILKNFFSFIHATIQTGEIQQLSDHPITQWVIKQIQSQNDKP